MYVFRIGFFVFLQLLAFSECNDHVEVYKAVLGEDFEADTLDGSDVPWSDEVFELFSDTGNASFPAESTNCSDMNSVISRGLKWMFANKVDLKKAVKLRVYLSTRKQTNRFEAFANDKFNLEKSDFNIERRTVVIVHGFLNSASESWIKKLEEAFLLWGDVNVLVVDWSAVGKTINYYKAAIMTRVVGFEIARFLHRVVNVTVESNPQPKWGKLHLVGHSLGSHISGVAAYDFKKMQSLWQVWRITGLDPALPCFEQVTDVYRLDPTDAKLVDVLHTSATEKWTVGFGNVEPLGHVDFYPNGGKRQPGCHRVQGSIFDFVYVPVGPIKRGTCSHSRAQEYFTESLVNAAKGGCTFWAKKWDRTYNGAMNVITQSCDKSNCIEMGIQTENYSSASGTYFVTTAKRSPYCVTNKQSIEENKYQLELDFLNDGQQQ
ncbi:pancreatic triacylglycerol lipase-like [Venturia canescens]|uniref:pancreatic triacylglycerol lipase-like n=1 Tax=Venturia canescens TaxID=32260 RepID=UPI001C9CB1B1|nr:pancreatic triacylglycerol lipase-like [Venturia canescens]